MSLTTNSPADLSNEEIARQLEKGKSVMLAMTELLLEYAKRNGGKIPQWVFESLPRIAPQSCIELVIVRRSLASDQAVEILLYTRPPGDPWEGQLHMPGTTLYMFDAEKGQNSEALWQRLAKEIGRDKDLDENQAPYLATHLTTHAKRERGPCMHNIHILQVGQEESFPGGQWHFIEVIPNTIIEHHADMIRRVIDAVYEIMAFSPEVCN